MAEKNLKDCTKKKTLFAQTIQVATQRVTDNAMAQQQQQQQQQTLQQRGGSRIYPVLPHQAREPWPMGPAVLYHQDIDTMRSNHNSGAGVSQLEPKEEQVDKPS